jgi:hypothetical protein
MRFWLVAISIAFAAVMAHAADPLAGYVGSESLPRLRAGEAVKAALAENAGPLLVPAVDSAASISADVLALRPSVGAELLTILPGAGQSLDSPEGLLQLSNALLAVSTMKGITYWSVTRGKQMVLFLQSYAIDSPSLPSPLPDPSISEVPTRKDLVTIQEDSSFGKNTYAEHLTAARDHLHVKTENLSTITFLFVPLIQPHGFVSHVVVVPSGKDVLFYGLAYLKSGVPLGDRSSRTQSLENRLTAMAGWVAKRISTIPPLPTIPTIPPVPTAPAPAQQ